MDSSYDIAIVGAGLAGAFSAFNLSRGNRVVILERDQPASAASGAGAGLVNPFMGRKANTIWRWKEAIEALEQSLAAAGGREIFRKQGLLRPAADERQISWFREIAQAQPDWCKWMDGAVISSRWPAIHAPNGGLLIPGGGSVDQLSLVESLLRAAEKRGCEIHDQTLVTGIRDGQSGVIVETDGGDLTARRVLLCVGADFGDWGGVLPLLPLHSLKGQTIVVERPSGLGTGLPCISGPGYIVPYPDQMVLGSTYHHDFKDRNPTTADTLEILAKARESLPALTEARVVSAAAGVRVTVPKTRLPLVGPVTASGRIWIFTGLGSKGVLMGALIGRDLPSFMDSPETIPPELVGGLPDHPSRTIGRKGAAKE